MRATGCQEAGGQADGMRQEVRFSFYLHHHLLPGEWLACGGRGAASHVLRGQVGALQLQRDVAPLLFESAGQPLEARLLLLHRGQDAGRRTHVIVLHGAPKPRSTEVLVYGPGH